MDWLSWLDMVGRLLEPPRFDMGAATDVLCDETMADPSQHYLIERYCHPTCRFYEYDDDGEDSVGEQDDE